MAASTHALPKLEDLIGDPPVTRTDDQGQKRETGVGNSSSSGGEVTMSDAEDRTRVTSADGVAIEDSGSSMMETLKMKGNMTTAELEGNSRESDPSTFYDASVCYFPSRIPGKETSTDAGSSRVGDETSSMKGKGSIRDDVSALTCDVDSTIEGAKTATTLASHSQVKSISARSSMAGQQSRFLPRGETFPEALEPQEKPRRPIRCLIIFVVVLLLVTAIGGAVIGTQLRGSIEEPPLTPPEPDLAPDTPSETPNFEGDELLELLKFISFDGGAALYEGSSPQYRAFIWLWEDDKLAGGWPNHTRIQRYALATLYYATGGYRWLNKQGWLSGASHCDWYSVADKIFCEEDNVTAIMLSDNNLAGTLPAEIGLLSSSLVFLNISNATLGHVPTEIGLLTKLEAVSMANSNLSSTIPSEVGALTSLQFLDVTRNPLTGKVPTELGNLEALRFFKASVTKITGGVPSTFGQLTLLEELDMYGIFQPGKNMSKIPTEIGLMTNLRMIRLDRSLIDGRIPSEIGNVRQLRRLILHNNAIQGKIPPHISRLTSLKSMILDANRLVGPIPTNFKRLSNLEVLSLGVNQLQSFDDSLFTLPKLEKLILYDNNFNGTIPTFIGRMSKLSIFDASRNKLSSTIPTEVGDAVQLRKFRVENNTLTGMIPAHIYNLVELNFLGLGPNNLIGGALHPRIRRLSHLDRLSVSNYRGSKSRLNGTLPSELGLLTKLTDVTIAITNVTGTVPTELGNLLDLKFLRIVHANMTGPIPSELGRLEKLQDLLLTETPFTGTVPSELGRIRPLKEVSMKGTALSGTMPREICGLDGLDLLEVNQKKVVCNCCGTINSSGKDD